MLFYKGEKIYHRLDRIPVKCFVVSVDRGNKRFFLNFGSFYLFEMWYCNLAYNERTINEIVLADRRKLIIDIDDDPHADLSLFDFERHVESRIHEVFSSLDIGVPEVIMYKMTDERGYESKLSYHAVVSNFSFDACTCMGLCIIISSDQVWEKCVDTGIYRSIQSIRMEGSTKFGTNSWKRACKKTPFRHSIISDLENTVCSNFLAKRIRRVCGVSSEADPEGFVSNLCHALDMSQFKAGKEKNNYIPLYRVKPGFCQQCERIHDRENAALVYRMGIPTFICWRFTAAAILLPAASG